MPQSIDGFHLAVSVVRDSQGDILVIHRTDPAYDHWELPGGKVKQGETPLSAAVREASEELGIALAATDVGLRATFVDRGTTNLCSFVIASIASGHPCIREPSLFDDWRFMSSGDLRSGRVRVSWSVNEWLRNDTPLGLAR
jgi:mutator protein MutT